MQNQILKKILDKPPCSLSADEVIKQLDTSHTGLSQNEAKIRLSKFGPNILPQTTKINLIVIFIRQFLDPFIYILLAAAVISLMLGEITDAVFIFIILLINAIIGTTQEYGAERSAISLREYITEFAYVIRDGESFEINTNLLVPGDLVLLQSGDKIPADVRLISEHDLQIDESLLTGESTPVEKNSTLLLPGDTSVADQLNMIFKGTLVLKGRAQGIIVTTGLDTQLGNIAEAVICDVKVKPPLLTRMERFTLNIALAIGFAVIAMASIMLFQGHAMREIFFIVVALAVAAIPEGLPVALTVALAIGVRRMAKRNVIVRRLVAVEALGSCTMIASDKTGTLTVNEITARQIVLPKQAAIFLTGEGIDPTGSVQCADGVSCTPRQKELLLRVGLAAALANEGFLGRRNHSWAHHGDTVDVAMLVMAQKLGVTRAKAIDMYPEIEVIPYESENRFSASVHQVDSHKVVFVKGAFEEIASMCNSMDSIEGNQSFDRAWFEDVAQRLAVTGYRVLAVAAGVIELGEGEKVSPNHLHNLTFLALVSMIDPLRPEARGAIQECRKAGIDVTMITGDHPQTAYAISRELGLATKPDQVIVGSEIRQLHKKSDDKQKQLIDQTRVFARVEPQQKLNIVHAMQRNGHYVAVTGDGANDAPALRAAHVGVAMGERGSDIVKETSDMIVTDDNFASIVSGIEEGRIAYANIRKVIFLLISAGAAEIVLVALALLSGLPIPLFAVQLLWLNLVTNGIQDVALAFEPAEGDELNKPPRPPNEKIFNKIMLERVTISAIVIGGLTFFTFQYSIAAGYTIEEARNFTLLLMVLFLNIHAFNSRSETRSVFKHNLLGNPLLLFGTISAQLLHIAAMYTPILRDILHIEPVEFAQWAYLLCLSITILIAMEAYKFIAHRKKKIIA